MVAQSYQRSEGCCFDSEYFSGFAIKLDYFNVTLIFRKIRMMATTYICFSAQILSTVAKQPLPTMFGFIDIMDVP